MTVELSRLNRNIRNLPIELISIICSYTYSPQPIEITKDILSYFESKAIIRSMFSIRYQDLMPYEKDADLNWLVSDVLCFMNRNLANYYRYQDQFYEICKRNYMLRDAKHPRIKRIANRSHYKNILFQFNVYWGLLTPDERNRFIDIQKKIRY
jgi:hypothetical protein